MSMNMNFNKKEYDRNYMKERRKELKQFKVDLPIAEKEELDLLLEQHHLSKVEFLKKAIANYKEELKKENKAEDIVKGKNKRAN